MFSGRSATLCFFIPESSQRDWNVETVGVSLLLFDPIVVSVFRLSSLMSHCPGRALAEQSPRPQHGNGEHVWDAISI